MSPGEKARRTYERQIAELVADARFLRLIDGSASRQDYDRFLERVFRTHVLSPQYLGFLYSVAPPAAADRLRHNLLEELGVEDDGKSHPDLLRDLLAAAGLTDRLAALQEEAQLELRATVDERLLYATLREVGFAALVEVTAFETMLSRVAGRIAEALEIHRRLPGPACAWFSHHAEVDLRHAEEGLQSIDDYVAFYRMDPADAETILEMRLRENVFIKRYLR